MCLQMFLEGSNRNAYQISYPIPRLFTLGGMCAHENGVYKRSFSEKWHSGHMSTELK